MSDSPYPMNRIRNRPVLIGSSIGVEGGAPGTAACLVRDNTDNSICLLTLSSMMNGGDTLQPGPIYQPAPDPTSPLAADAIGTVKRYISVDTISPFYPTRRLPGTVTKDAAIIALNSPGLVDNHTTVVNLEGWSRLHPLIGIIVGLENEVTGAARYIALPIGPIMSALSISPLNGAVTATPTVGRRIHFVGASSGLRETSIIDTGKLVDVRVQGMTPRMMTVGGAFRFAGDFYREEDIGSAVFGWAGNSVDSQCSGCAIATNLEGTYGIPFTQEVDLADHLRDEYLMESITGRMLVNLFYRNEDRFRARIAAASPTEAEVDYARILFKRYSTIAENEMNAVSSEYVPITQTVMDDFYAALYGLSRYMTDNEYTASKNMLNIIEEIKGKNVDQVMAFMNETNTRDRVLTQVQSVPGWDTSYDAG